MHRIGRVGRDRFGAVPCSMYVASGDRVLPGSAESAVCVGGHVDCGAAALSGRHPLLELLGLPGYGVAFGQGWLKAAQPLLGM